MNTPVKLLLSAIAILGLLAMMPQNPGQDDPAAKADVQRIVPLSQLQYVDLNGKTTALAARSMIEVRLVDDASDRLRLEVFYDNGDYSLMDVQAVHVIRAGQDVQEVRFVRTKKERLQFPLLR